MIYVDDRRERRSFRMRHRKVSRMFSVPPDDRNLLAFADSIGVPRRQFCRHYNLRFYEICERERQAAIRAGAAMVPFEHNAKARKA